MLCRAAGKELTNASVNDLTDRFPGLAEPLRAGSGVWERDGERYRCVAAEELASGEWPALLRWLDESAQRMRASG